MDSAPDVLELVARYAQLQAALISALDQAQDIRHLEYFNSLGTGRIRHGEQDWEYCGHGRGVTFTHDGVVVNAHVATALADAVDAWRLSLYAETSGINRLFDDGRVVEASVDDLGQSLHRLADCDLLLRVQVKGAGTTHVVFTRPHDPRPLDRG